MELEPFVIDFRTGRKPYRRISPIEHRATPLSFGDSLSRFSGPAMVTPNGRKAFFGVLYMAEDYETALAETVIRNRSKNKRGYILANELRSRVVFGLRTVKPLRLMDVRGAQLNKLGIDPNVVHDDDPEYTLSQGFSLFVYNHVPSIDGIIYRSWHTSNANIALYSRATHKLRCVSDVRLADTRKTKHILDDHRLKVFDKQPDEE